MREKSPLELTTRNEKNSLLRNIGRFFPLDEDETRLLRRLEKEPIDIASGERLWLAGAEINKLYVIQKGWACTYRDNHDGTRQIIEVLLPGDILGLCDFTFEKHFANARMITDGTVYSFSYQHIVDLVHDSPRLAIALFASISRQEVLLTERMLSNIHRSARSRIICFMLEIYTRLQKLGMAGWHHFHFPISQQMLGDILGLTNVHVSRTLIAIEQDNILKKHRTFVEILDKEKLLQEVDFDDAYLSDESVKLQKYLAFRNYKAR